MFYVLGEDYKREIDKLLEKKPKLSLSYGGASAYNQWHSWLTVNSTPSVTISGIDCFFASPVSFSNQDFAWHDHDRICLVAVPTGVSLITDESYLAKREGTYVLDDVKFPVYSTCGCGGVLPVASGCPTCWDVVCSIDGDECWTVLLSSWLTIITKKR